MYGGAGKRFYLGNGDTAVCDCKGAGGRRFSANNIGMGEALTVPMMAKGRTKKVDGVKRPMSNKGKSWQAEVARAFQNLRNANPAASRMNAMREAKTRRVAGTVPADLTVAAATAANIVLNSGSGNAKTRKMQRNIERAEKAAAAAAAKAEKAAVAAAAKAEKAEAAAATKAAKAAESQAKKNEKMTSARAKAEAVAQAAAARLAALQAKLMGTPRN